MSKAPILTLSVSSSTYLVFFSSSVHFGCCRHRDWIHVATDPRVMEVYCFRILESFKRIRRRGRLFVGWGIPVDVQFCLCEGEICRRVRRLVSSRPVQFIMLGFCRENGRERLNSSARAPMCSPFCDGSTRTAMDSACVQSASACVVRQLAAERFRLSSRSALCYGDYFR